MRDEVGLRPHLRGSVGVSTRGRDTGDAQIFVDLVDLPRLDHIYTVFAEVSGGFETLDAIVEGDVIERAEIVEPERQARRIFEDGGGGLCSAAVAERRDEESGGRSDDNRERRNRSCRCPTPARGLGGQPTSP